MTLRLLVLGCTLAISLPRPGEVLIRVHGTDTSGATAIREFTVTVVP